MKQQLASVLVGALALTSLASAWAVEYRGTLKDDGRDIPVVLDIDPAAGLGDRAGKVRFNGNWKCGFDLEYSGASGQVDSYGLEGAGPGLCGPLAQGYLQSSQGGGGLQLQLFTQRNKLAYSLTVLPSGK